MRAFDVCQAYSLVDKILTTLKALRKNSSLEFNKQFAEATKLRKQLHGEDFELTKPRLTSRQIHRSNPPSCTAKDYYRISIYDEFLSHVVAELEERFLSSPSCDIVTGLLKLVPSVCVGSDVTAAIPEDLGRAIEMFKDDVPQWVMMSTEYDAWVRQWKQSPSAEVPNTLVDALHECSTLAFPNISQLLKLTLTLPVTSSESERSFSQLKLIKTARRSNIVKTKCLTTNEDQQRSL